MHVRVRVRGSSDEIGSGNVPGGGKGKLVEGLNEELDDELGRLGWPGCDEFDGEMRQP